MRAPGQVNRAPFCVLCRVDPGLSALRHITILTGCFRSLPAVLVKIPCRGVGATRVWGVACLPKAKGLGGKGLSCSDARLTGILTPYPGMHCRTPPKLTGQGLKGPRDASSFSMQAASQNALLTEF